MRRAQSGVALAGVLALVLVVAMLSLAALERAFWQTRLAAGGMAEQQAFEAAEAALRLAQADPARYARQPLKPAPAGDARAWRSVLERSGQSVTALSDYPAARLLVESMSQAHRITVLGYSLQGEKTAVLQAVVAADDSAYLWRRLR